MSTPINRNSPEEIEATKASLARIAAQPGKEVRRDSLQKLWRFARLGGPGGYVEIRALGCSGSKWVWTQDDMTVRPGTAVAYVQTADEAEVALAAGDDGWPGSTLREDKELATDAGLRPSGYYYIPCRVPGDTIDGAYGAGTESGHVGWHPVKGGSTLVDDAKLRAAVVTVLSVDIDPKRDEPNATDDEQAMAFATAIRVRDFLISCGAPETALGWGSSGNGARCDIAVELPVDKGYSALVGRFLSALSRIFDVWEGDRQVIDIDRSCCNPSRLLPLPGAVKAKGEHTAERPHRRSWFTCHDEVSVLDRAQFVELVDAVEEKAKSFPLPKEDLKILGEVREPPNLNAIPMEKRIERAKSYASKLPPAIQGQGGDARTWAVCLGVARGFALGEDEAYEVLEGWNQNCEPPWEEQDLRRKIKDALEKGQTAIGCKLGRNSQGSGPELKPADWEKWFIKEKNGKSLKGCRENLVLALKYDDGLEGVVAYDVFAHDVVFRKEPPWLYMFPESKGDTPVGSPWKDVDDLRLAEYLNRKYKLRGLAVKTTIQEALLLVSRANQWHPLREWLDSLKWDGKARIGAWGPSIPSNHPTTEKPWLEEYCQAIPSYGFEEEGISDEQAEQRGRTYLRLAGQWMLLQMVARVYQPGAKCDLTLCFEGGQGYQKSSMLEALAGEKYFSDGDLGDLKNKESVMQIQGIWLQELAEGSIFSRASRRDLKAFVSKRYDTIVPKFSNKKVKHPRQVLLASTLNDSTYLDDSTGERRFIPVRLPDTRQEVVDIDEAINSGVFEKPRKLDLNRLKEAREQLFAEAVYLYKQKVQWWPSTVIEERLCDLATGARKIEHPLRDKLAVALKKAKDRDRGYTIGEIMDLIDMAKPENLKNNPDVLRIKGYLQDLGWQRKLKRSSAGQGWIRGPKADPYEEPDYSEIDKVEDGSPRLRVVRGGEELTSPEDQEFTERELSNWALMQP